MMMLAERSLESRSAAHWARLLGLIAVLLTALLAGCGGGGGGNPTTNTNQTTLITGRVNSIASDISGTLSPIAGATVTFVNSSGTTLASAITPATGDFSLSVPATTAGFLKIDVAGYYDTVQYTVNGSTVAGSRAAGISLTTGTATVPTALGNLRLTSTDGPPPPPGI